jgi:hypothetical protein
MERDIKFEPVDAIPVPPGSAGEKRTGFFEDLNLIRVDTAAAGLGVQEIGLHLPVRKPIRHEFFRVHPDPNMSIVTSVYADKDEGVTYYVTPTMRDALLGEARPALLLPVITTQRGLMMWPLMLALDTGRRNAWADTAREAVEHAKKDWVRMFSDRALGAYRILKAEAALPDPKWPDKPLEQLLEAAFKDLVIDSEDHPVVRRLRGLV